MREIKFRAWDGEKKHMWHNQFCISSYGRFHAFEPVREYFNFNPRDYILMQYTGLLDKNGVEIYEGDWIIFNSARYKYPVEMKDGCWKVGGSILGNLKKTERVGNIYENKDLLTPTHEK